MARAALRRRHARRHGVLVGLALLSLTAGWATQVVQLHTTAASSSAAATAARLPVSPVAPNATVEVPGGVIAPTRTYPALALPSPAARQPFVVVAPHGVIPSYAPPTAGCGGYGMPRVLVPTPTPQGGGVVAVSFSADVRPSVQGYRVTAVDQVLVGGAQPVPPSVSVEQTTACVDLDTSVSGLTVGDRYEFWLEELVHDPVADVSRYVMTGRSPVVVVE